MRSLSFGIFLCLLKYGSASQDFNITPIKTSSGLYYEKIGDVLLSNNNWEFVTSVDYAGYLLFYQYLQNQAEKLHDFCQEYQPANCEERFALIRTALARIDETDENMANFLGIKTEKRRVKRFWSEIGNFFKGLGRTVLGGVSTIFGGGGHVDLSAYDQQIGSLQSGQRELENRLNQQTTLFLVDSERKASQIQWLEKTQGELQNKIGSLESDFHKDSEDKQKQLNELKSMLDETNEKLEKQEKVQKKLVGAVAKIEKTLLKIDGEIKNISADVAKNAKDINELKLEVKLNSLSSDFTTVMNQFKDEQDKLYDVIKKANKGELDPYILTPLNLIRMLQDIQPSLTEGHQFPFYPNLENAARLYSIIKPQVYLFNYKIIFIMKIPLVDYRKFNIHKMTSMPVPVAPTKFAFILPQEPFLLVDNNYQEFLLMSNDEFRDFCTEISKNRYFCKQIQHTSKVHSSNVCEIELFLTASKIPESCDKRGLIMEQPMFLQLQQPRSWIYVIPQHETLIITCGSRRLTAAVEGSGFISLAEDCNGGTTEVNLKSLTEYTKPALSNFSAPLDLTSAIDLSNIDNWEVARKRIHKQIVLPFDFSHLDEISFALIYQGKNWSWIYYTVAVVMILAAGATGYFVYRNQKSRIDFYIGRLMEVIWGSEPQHTTVADNRDNGGVGDDRLKLKVKLNRKDEKITKVSVQEHQSSNDPEAEYLTVRFKVQKDTPVASKAVHDRMLTKNEDEPVYGNTESSSIDDDVYLKQLRKFKPARL